MSRKTTIEDLLKLTVALCTSGGLLAASCSVQGARAVGAGIDAAANYLDNEDEQGEDISFGDWLLDELED